METGRKIPQHIAIILDGNGRWAKAKGMPRNYGHTAGARNVETVCQAAHDLGVKYVTMYAFSTENWNRPEGEVEALMKLLESYLKNCIKTADKNNMRVRVIGDTTRLSERFQERIRELEAASAKNDGLNLQIAINYGSRDEMTRAMRRMSEDVAAGKRKPEEITESVFEEYLDTAGIPDPDLLIRTCNENTRLTIAADLLQPDQLIRTERIAAWKNKTPDIHKRPTIFILGV